MKRSSSLFIVVAVVALAAIEATIAWHYLKKATQATRLVFVESEFARSQSHESRSSQALEEVPQGPQAKSEPTASLR